VLWSLVTRQYGVVKPQLEFASTTPQPTWGSPAQCDQMSPSSNPPIQCSRRGFEFAQRQVWVLVEMFVLFFCDDSRGCGLRRKRLYCVQEIRHDLAGRTWEKEASRAALEGDKDAAGTGRAVTELPQVGRSILSLSASEHCAWPASRFRP
jgi:hypothetical protein